MLKVLLPIIFLLLVSCKHSDSKPGDIKLAGKSIPSSEGKIVKILPMGRVDDKFIQTTFEKIKAVVPYVVLLHSAKMPTFSYYSPRNRYRADSLIKWMSGHAKKNETFIGITQQDISTDKGEIRDYGVMGLGYQPGKACIASNFRLKDKSNFYKVALHELGHTTGLPHCPHPKCFMVDAKGGDPTGEEENFCSKCALHLQDAGWRL
jgi:archaemetzincin